MTIEDLIKQADIDTIDSSLVAPALGLEAWIVNGFIARYILLNTNSVFTEQRHLLTAAQLKDLIYLLPLTPSVARARLDLTMRLLAP